MLLNLNRFPVIDIDDKVLEQLMKLADEIIDSGLINLKKFCEHVKLKDTIDETKTENFMNMLNLRADYEKALVGFYIGGDKKGLGFTETDDLPKAIGMNLNVYMDDKVGDSQRTVLVGFEGFTDADGAISSIRFLILEEKWVEPDDPRCANRFCEGLKGIIST